MRRLWPLAIIVASIIVVVVALSKQTTPVSIVTIWPFLLVCPGMAFIRLVGIADWVTEVTIAVALSLALDAAVAMLLVFGERWSPVECLGLLAGISCTGAMLQIRRYGTLSGRARSIGCLDATVD